MVVRAHTTPRPDETARATTTDRSTPASSSPSSSPSPSSAPPSPPGTVQDWARGRRIPVDARLAQRGDEARRALDAAAPDAGPDEQLLHELAARQLPLVLQLHEIEEQLATRLGLVMDDPKLAVVVVRVLRETVAIASATSKRVQSTLTAASALRAQRRFLVLHRRTLESHDED